MTDTQFNILPEVQQIESADTIEREYIEMGCTVLLTFANNFTVRYTMKTLLTGAVECKVEVNGSVYASFKHYTDRALFDQFSEAMQRFATVSTQRGITDHEMERKKAVHAGNEFFDNSDEDAAA